MSGWLLAWCVCVGVAVICWMFAWWVESQTNADESIGMGLLFAALIVAGAAPMIVGLFGIAGWVITWAFGS